MTNTIPIAENNFGNRVFSKIFPMILLNSYDDLNFREFDLQMNNFNGYKISLLEEQNISTLMEKLKEATTVTS